MRYYYLLLIMKSKYLWIIDIDGTILNVHKNQIPAWNKAFQVGFNITPDEQTLIKFFGKPFKSVMRNVALAYGVSDATISKKYRLVLDTYISSVCEYLDKTGGEIIPGAVEFLRNLGDQGMVRAIATGNPEGEGKYKLAHFDLLKYFDITVYCEDRAERIEMVEEAIRQAEQSFDLDLHTNPKHIVVIGDSLHDVESAVQTGATGIGVTTGHWSEQVLMDAGADYVFSGVHEYKKILDTVCRQ